MSRGPSAHLSWKELACKDGTPYPDEWRKSRGAPLAQEFEAIRFLVGHPIVVGSAYRTRAHNRAVGGARHSQHVEGRALDLYPPRPLTVEELHRLVVARARDDNSLIRGVGLYPTFVHFDIRHSPHKLVHWQGSRTWAEVV